MDVNELRERVVLMRELGVTRWGDIELGPAPRVEPPPAKPEKPEAPPVCACGHLWNEEHGPAGCLLGCHVERCNDAPERVPEGTQS